MNLSPEIENYCIEHSTRPSDLARELQLQTMNSVHGAQMLIGEMEASLLQTLIHLGRVKHVLEFGTFTGYSALIMAEALPSEGTVTTLDINPHTVALAKTFWERSVHGKKITSILKPGIEAMHEIDKKFDLIFIDADKSNYSNYLEWSLNHLTERGMIIVDNTLWKGKVLNPEQDKQTSAIHAHNEKAKKLEGYIKTLLPIRDGMFLIQKGF